ncbi:hypothetical protein [Streptomyces yerevanensis]|uniref:hypothetical protein n=1 Tax=Streptomyces yerevanensis TaxID=66378 RepID=UPI000B0090F0|nr:hypothetical protein [Streptomyces yerevanensis]
MISDRFNLPGDHTEWQKDFERRLHASYTAAGPGATAAEHMLEDVRASISDWTVAEITDAGTQVGYVGVVVADDNGTLAGRIGDLRVDALHAGRPHEQAARDWAEGWCAERGAHRLDIRLNARSWRLGADVHRVGRQRGGNEAATNLYTSAGYQVMEENPSIDLPGPRPHANHHSTTQPPTHYLI